MKNISKVLVLSFASLFAVGIALAATTDFTAIENIIVPDVIFDGSASTSDMLIIATSTAESWGIASGLFSVTNAGDFKVGSSDSVVKSILVKLGTANVACQENTTPGSSYVTVLNATTSAYTVKPSTISSCQTLCTQLAGATAYNHFPTCGALTCSTGYAKSGSGAGATCLPASSPPPSGGGGSSNPNVPKTITSLFATTTEDGTKVVSEVFTTEVRNLATDTRIESTLTPPAEPSAGQIVSLNTTATAEASSVQLELSKEVLKELAGGVADSEIKITINSNEATFDQKNSQARNGMFMIGFDVFSVNVSVGQKAVTSFSNPLTLSFDIGKISNPQSLKVYYFNTTANAWLLAGDGGRLNGGQLQITINHLTEFTLMKEVKDIPLTEVLGSRALEWQQISNDAGVVLKSGLSIENLNKFVAYAKKVKDSRLQAEAMEKYTKKIAKGIVNFPAESLYNVNNFIVYGTVFTDKLGMGERAGVVSSYKKAYGKLPTTEAEWTDCLAIASGRWPGEKNVKAEDQAQKDFIKVYKRSANMSNSNDNAAVTVMAYGLRMSKRNMTSEIIAAKTFRAIYGKGTTLTSDWDIVRAIAYSGAKR